MTWWMLLKSQADKNDRELNNTDTVNLGRRNFILFSGG